MNGLAPQTKTAQRVYAAAKECLGDSLVPIGDDPDVGCAISVSVLLRDMCGIGIKETLSTSELLQEMISSTFFVEVQNPAAGDVIISATGTSVNPKTLITHGHVGVVGLHGILSNNSMNGLWSENYTLDTWKARYQSQGGYPVRYFRLL